jgi:hypothetical protein
MEGASRKFTSDEVYFKKEISNFYGNNILDRGFMVLTHHIVRTKNISVHRAAPCRHNQYFGT